jgi:hypothetical protein
LRKKADVTGRWHDNRHTLITDLAESGASDQTIMDIAGHVSKQMLKHYSHIRMEAKRTALESIVEKKPVEPTEPEQDHSPVPTVKQQIEVEYPQKSPQSDNSGRVCGKKKDRKSLKKIGASGRTRTYNPSVNSLSLNAEKQRIYLSYQWVTDKGFITFAALQPFPRSPAFLGRETDETFIS